jgi:hypothetical protein
MMLTESINRGHACQVTIAARKPPRTAVTRVQEGCVPCGPPQASYAGLAAHLHNRRAFAICGNRRQRHTTWPSATTYRQVLAMRSFSTPWQGMHEALALRALPGPDRHTPWVRVCPNGAQGRITPRHRPAIDDVLEAGRHYGRGGQAHVLAVPGAAPSQAPPISHTDGAARQDHDSRTVM